LSPVLDWSAHCGLAVTPVGMSVGHAEVVHFGTHASPFTPWIWIETCGKRRGVGGREEEVGRCAERRTVTNFERVLGWGRRR
jgi:hypothetical protein